MVVASGLLGVGGKQFFILAALGQCGGDWDFRE